MTAGLNPNETSRAMAYQLWMHAPNPMVTLFKTLDVTNLVRVSRKQNLKFNMQMDGAHAGRFLENLQNEITSAAFR